MYKVFTRLGNRDFIEVETCEVLEQAVQLIKGLNCIWPGEYVVRDAEGNDLGHTVKHLNRKWHYHPAPVTE